MPTWGQILGELNQSAQARGGRPDFDGIRRGYLAALARSTGRAAILYATKWTAPGAPPELTSITPEDTQGMMEVVHGITVRQLDLVLHSPGGSPEATEALVSYLRSKFDDIRVLIPHAAMSAATMWACAANRIVMGRHSFLGPIDPQFILQTELGTRSVPAHAIEEQFAMAKGEIQQDANLLPAWLPILRQYGPALILQCRIARRLSETLVRTWLAQYMLAGQPNAGRRAKTIARRLAQHGRFLSHSRFINRDGARALGLLIDDLEGDQRLQDGVLSVFHATTHTFNGTAAVKLIENHAGRAFIKTAGQMVMPQPQILPAPPPGPPQQP